MSRYCIDTSAYGQFCRGHAKVVDLVDSAKFIAVPAVVAGELWSGFLLGARREENEAELDEFLRHPVVKVLDVDLEVAKLYGEIFGDLRRAGTPVPTNDIWVAATAVHAGLAVLTFDSDFEMIQRVGSIILDPQPEMH